MFAINHWCCGPRRLSFNSVCLCVETRRLTVTWHNVGDAEEPGCFRYEHRRLGGCKSNFPLTFSVTPSALLFKPSSPDELTRTWPRTWDRLIPLRVGTWKTEMKAGESTVWVRLLHSPRCTCMHARTCARLMWPSFGEHVSSPVT